MDDPVKEWKFIVSASNLFDQLRVCRKCCASGKSDTFWSSIYSGLPISIWIGTDLDLSSASGD